MPPNKESLLILKDYTNLHLLWLIFDNVFVTSYIFLILVVTKIDKSLI